MRAVFRVDSSFKIGTGHLMRCLTLADELKLRGVIVEFISRDSEGNLGKLSADKGYKLHLLPRGIGGNENYSAHAEWLETPWQDDAKEVISIAKGADWLVVDHYAIDARWEKTLRPFVKKIAVIDDLADRTHDCDLLLDQNYYNDAATRYDGLVPNDCVLLVMPKYSLLRPEFSNARKTLPERNAKAKKILIFFGGVDLANDNMKALIALKNFEAEIKIVAGGANKNFAELEKFCHGKNNLTLYKTANMSELMLWADIAVGSGGSTNWERACLGLPSFLWAIADNQVPILHDLDEFGAVKSTSAETLLADILNADLSAMSSIAKSLTDGKGAARMANYMVFKLRKANGEDCQRIWEIRNEEVIRKNSTNQEIISFEAHQKWFMAALEKSERHILVLVNDKDIAGVLRFDVKMANGEVSIYLNPKYFNLQLGENLLERGLAYIKDVNLKTLSAEILPDNLKSQSLFARFGFMENNGSWIKSL